MMDGNRIIITYLLADAGIDAIAGDRIFVPNLPEGTAFPAVSFFTRGGDSTPYIPGVITPSVQLSTWDDTPDGARTLYVAVYDALQGIQNQTVTVGGNDYQIMGAREEVQGQDLQDVEFPNRYRVLSFWEIMLRADT